jgi:hypothetical protein
MKTEGAKSHRTSLIIAAAIIGAVIIVAFAYWASTPPQEPVQDPANPSEFEQSTPEVSMVYNGESHAGDLLGATFDATVDAANLPEPIPFDDISGVSTPAVTVQQGSAVTFEIRGGPWISGAGDTRSAEPDVLAIDAHPMSGNGETLSIQQDSRTETFPIDLQPGEYVLTATATWLAATPPAESQEAPINGYVIYGYRIIVE